MANSLRGKARMGLEYALRCTGSIMEQCGGMKYRQEYVRRVGSPPLPTRLSPDKIHTFSYTLSYP